MFFFFKKTLTAGIVSGEGEVPEGVGRVCFEQIFDSDDIAYTLGHLLIADRQVPCETKNKEKKE